MGRVRMDGLVGTGEFLEQGQEGIEDQADGGGADLNQRGAGDGDDVILGKVLGWRAGAVGKLLATASASIDPFHLVSKIRGTQRAS
jgi:hypothetical protein